MILLGFNAYKYSPTNILRTPQTFCSPLPTYINSELSTLMEGHPLRICKIWQLKDFFMICVQNTMQAISLELPINRHARFLWSSSFANVSYIKLLIFIQFCCLCSFTIYALKTRINLYADKQKTLLIFANTILSI